MLLNIVAGRSADSGNDLIVIDDSVGFRVVSFVSQHGARFIMYVAGCSFYQVYFACIVVYRSDVQHLCGCLACP